MPKSSNNNSATNLIAYGSFLGLAEASNPYVEVMVSLNADRDINLVLEQSADKLNWDALNGFVYTAGSGKTFSTAVKHAWFRVRLTNTSALPTTFLRMSTHLNEEHSQAVAVGTDGQGVQRNILVDENGKLSVTLTGTVGPDGKSAYQVALDEGFVGTELQWLATLVGPQGATGATGATGAAGQNGSDGEKGDTGLQGLPGVNGSNGISINVKGTLTTAEIQAVVGPQVNDAYFSSTDYKLYVFDGQVWVSSESLRGAVGATGATGPQGIQGIAGSDGANILVLGNLANAGLLPVDAQLGHAYFIDDTFQLAVSRGPTLWSYSGSLRGVQGAVGPAGATGPVGAGVVAKGSVADEAALLALPTPSAGDLYIVEADYKMYIYDGAAFQNSGVSMRGATGAQGPQGIQGTVGSTGAQGYSITVMGNVATAGLLPAGYDGDDVGKAWFVNDTYVMAVWDGANFQSSASLRGATGATGATGPQGVAGVSIDFLGTVADGAALTAASATWGQADLNKSYYVTSTHALNVWNGTAFVATGSLQGDQGIQGVQGVQGYSFSFEGTDTSVNILALAYGAADQGKTWLASDNYQLYSWNGSAFITSNSIRGATGATGAQGASIVFKGNVADAAALAAQVSSAAAGDAWFRDDNYTLNVFDGVSFVSSGSLRGETGPAGADGADAVLPIPALIYYSVASGTAGGTAVVNTWNTKPLNSSDDAFALGISLSTNTITFSTAGTYFFDFSSNVFDAGDHQARLRRTNNTPATIALGHSDSCSNGNTGHSSGKKKVVVSAGDTIQLQHYISALAATNTETLGLPVSHAAGQEENEMYACISITKLA